MIAKCVPKKLEGGSCIENFECQANNCEMGKCKSLMSEMDTQILSTTEQFDLLNFIGFRDKIFRLAYRASRDGWRGYDFHDHCNFIPNTLTIVKTTTGYILGGFVELWWSSRDEYASDKQSFLFSFTNTIGTPFLMKMQRSDGYEAIYTGQSYGK